MSGQDRERARVRERTRPDVDEIATRLDRIQALADELAKCDRDVFDQMDLATRLHIEILAAKIALGSFPPCN